MFGQFIAPTVLVDLLWWLKQDCPAHPRHWDILGLFGEDPASGWGK